MLVQWLLCKCRSHMCMGLKRQVLVIPLKPWVENTISKR